MNKQEFENLIYETFDQLMEQSENLVLEKTPDCALTGDGSELDSLGLVNFLVALEQRLQSEISPDVTIANRDLVMGADQPLKDVDSLASYLAEKLG